MSKFILGFLMGAIIGGAVMTYSYACKGPKQRAQVMAEDFRYAAYFFRSDGLPKIRMFEDGTFVLHDSLGNKSVIIKNTK